MSDVKRGPGKLSYLIAGLGFVPLFGMPFALATIVTGFCKLKRGGVLLIALGALPVVLTVGSYGTLFYKGFVEKGGAFDDLRRRLIVSQLDGLVKDIEFYKIQHGAYPQDLDALVHASKDGDMVFIYDMSSPLEHQTEYYYRLATDKTHYYLRSAGRDHVPFTADDVIPSIPAEARARTGLLIDRKDDAGGT